MTDRNGGEHDVLRCDQAPEVPPEHKQAAAERAAEHAHDADDLRALLDALGIDPAELRRTCAWCGARRDQLSAAIGSRWYCHGDGEATSCYEQAQRPRFQVDRGDENAPDPFAVAREQVLHQIDRTLAGEVRT